MQNPLASKRVVICAGPGGVGKTTTAAALAVAAARAGVRTVVATIDPAPRLVDALALPELDATPRPLPAPTAERLGVPKDHVFASRIDAAAAFATLVAEYAKDQGRKQRILSNTIYQQITTTLTGAQEYAAALSLEALAADPRFDLVVLDTPPAANALEFFDAPSRLAAAIESPLVRWLLPHGRGRKLLTMGTLSSGGGVVLRALSRLVGSQFLADLGEFLADFQPVLEGFSARTQSVESRLKGPDTVVVVVCIPEPQAMDEAMVFSTQLAELGVAPRAFIVNRVMPTPGLVDAPGIAAALGQLPDVQQNIANVQEAAAVLAEAAATVKALAAQQLRQRDRLAGAFPSSAVATMPLQEATPNALDLLHETSTCLAAKGLTPRSPLFRDQPLGAAD